MIGLTRNHVNNFCQPSDIQGRIISTFLFLQWCMNCTSWRIRSL